jgi:hypothetical protein
MEFSSLIKKNEIMLLAGNGITAHHGSKISHIEKDKYHMFFLIHGI